MLRTTALFALLLLLTAASCRKDKAEYGTLELQFKAYYDDQPLIMLQPYVYNDTLDVMFQRFNFYISNVEINSGQSVDPRQLIDIDFVDFDGVDNVAAADAGDLIQVEKVPTGAYDQLSIGLGVPADLNATQESDYPDSHPLGKESHYWTAWQSYIFTMIAGKVDTDKDGVFDDSSIGYHLGSDPTYRTVNLAHSFEIQKGQTTLITLAVDLHQIFKEGDGYMDIIAIPATHTIANLDQAIKAMDNFQHALHIE